MAAGTELNVTIREAIGKANRKLADANQIPAVLYGRGRAPQSLALDRHEFELFTAHHATGSTLIELLVDGAKKPIPVMIREVQHSAVKGSVLHVDFLEVSMDTAVNAMVAVHLLSDPEGVRAGGVLNVNLHEISVEAKPGEIPDAIEADVEALQIGDSLHVRDLVAPAGVTILDDPEAIVASVQAPRVEVEEAEVEEAAEPELIGKDESDEQE